MADLPPGVGPEILPSGVGPEITDGLPPGVGPEIIERPKTKEEILRAPNFRDVLSGAVEKLRHPPGFDPLRTHVIPDIMGDIGAYITGQSRMGPRVLPPSGEITAEGMRKEEAEARVRTRDVGRFLGESVGLQGAASILGPAHRLFGRASKTLPVPESGIKALNPATGPEIGRPYSSPKFVEKMAKESDDIQLRLRALKETKTGTIKDPIQGDKISRKDMINRLSESMTQHSQLAEEAANFEPPRTLPGRTFEAGPGTEPMEAPRTDRLFPPGRPNIEPVPTGEIGAPLRPRTAPDQSVFPPGGRINPETGITEYPAPERPETPVTNTPKFQTPLGEDLGRPAPVLPATTPLPVNVKPTLPTESGTPPIIGGRQAMVNTADMSPSESNVFKGIRGAFQDPAALRIEIAADEKAARAAGHLPETTNHPSPPNILQRATSKIVTSPETYLSRSEPGRQIYQHMVDAQTDQHVFHQYFDHLLAQAESGLTKSSIETVNKALDTGITTGFTAQEQTAFTKMNEYRQKLSRWTDVPFEDIKLNYFPHLRDRSRIMGKDVLEVGNHYIPLEVQRDMSRKVSPSFLKARTSEEPPTNYTIEPWKVLNQAAARKIAMKGGINPLTDENIPGMISNINPLLKQLPEGQMPLVGQYTDRILGVHNFSPTDIITTRMARNMNRLNFDTQIGGNFVSPVQNLTQQFLTFVHTKNPYNFGMGYVDLAKAGLGKNPELLKELQLAGIKGQLTAEDVKFLSQMSDKSQLVKGYNLLRHAASIPFRASEFSNQALSFATQLREAKQLGLVGTEARQYALRKTMDTQFNWGGIGLPQGLSGQGAMSMVMQYKQYPYGALKWTKNIIKNDATDFAKTITTSIPNITKAVQSGDPHTVATALTSAAMNAPTRLIKLMVAGSALFGSDAIFAGTDKAVSNVISNDPQKYSIENTLLRAGVPKPIAQGLIPYSGIWIGNQIGMGAIPVEDYRNMLFMLPGPTVSRFSDVVSAAASFASGKDYDLSVQNLTNWDQPKQGIDYEKQTSKLIKGLMPIGGIGVNRLRRAGVQLRSEDQENVRKPVTLGQVWGRDPVTDRNPLMYPAAKFEAGRQFLGIQTPAQNKVFEETKEINELRMDSKQVVQHAIKMGLAGGDLNVGQQILDRYNQANDTSVHFTPQAIQTYVKETALPKELTELLRSPRSIRSRVLDLQKGFHPEKQQ